MTRALLPCSSRVALVVLGVVLAPLAGCAVAPASGRAEVAPEGADAHAEPGAETSPAATVADARDQLRALHTVVDGWSADDRWAAREAAHTLLVSCPYNRAAAQLPLALRQSLAPLEGAGLSPAQRAELGALQDGLILHEALVDRITGGELPRPAVADHLDQLDAFVLPSAHALRLDADPVSRTAALVARVPDIVRSYPPDVLGRIEDASARLAVLTSVPPAGLVDGGDGGGPAAGASLHWPHKRVVRGWQAGLAALVPALPPGDERARAAAALELVEAFLGEGC